MTRAGTFPDGTEYVTWGSGRRPLVFLPGGPGSVVPSGSMLRLRRRQLRPYVDAGLTVWILTRRRGLPVGHTVADLAEDTADVLVRHLGDRPVVVVGESFGGLVAQHLAAAHPELVHRLVLVASGHRVGDWCRAVDARIVAGLERGDTRAAAEAFTEYLLPGDGQRGLRRALAPVVERTLLSGRDFPVSDVLVEARAERQADTSDVLPSVRAPTLVLCGDRDRFFPREVVERTVGLLADADVRWYRGRGHVGVAASPRVPRDVVSFLRDEDGREV